MTAIFRIFEQWLISFQCIPHNAKIPHNPEFFQSESSLPYSIEEYFLKRLHDYEDLWNLVLSDNTLRVCCPPSNSLNPKKISKEFLSSHLLRPRSDVEDGVYLNVLGETIQLVGNYLILLDRPYEQSNIDKRVRLMHSDQRISPDGNILTIFYICRPFKSGIYAPEDYDEIGASLINRYVAGLRSYPSMETAFVELDCYLKDLKSLGKMTNSQGYQRIRPSLVASLRQRWSQSTSQLIRLAHAIGIHSDSKVPAGLLSIESFGLIQYSDEHFGQIVETYMFKYCGKYIYRFLAFCFQTESVNFMLKVDHLRDSPIEVFGIKSHFAVPQVNAEHMLRNIRFASTPVDKLLVMKRTVQLIYDNVNEHFLNSNRSIEKWPQSEASIDAVIDQTQSSEYEFATDDLISILIRVIVNACSGGDDCVEGMNLVTDLRYCQEYHFCSSAKSAMAFVACHFDVCINWILDYERTSTGGHNQ